LYFIFTITMICGK